MMETNRNYQNCKLIRQEVDILLKEMATIFTNIGTDSTQEEVAEAYRKEDLLIDKIAELDPAKAQSLRASY
jgi:hypothetical protein